MLSIGLKYYFQSQIPFCTDFTHNCPDDYQYWKEEEVHEAVEPMKPVVKLLQEELGDTVPPVTDVFFIWLCYFFPHRKN